MGPLGMPEMIAIFVIALLLFGPKKLPELGRTLGKAITEFRRAKNELKSTFESHLHELERETRMPELTSSSSYSMTTDYSPSRYSYPYEDYNYESGDPSNNGSSQASNSSSQLNGSSDTGSPQTSAAGTNEVSETEANREHSSSLAPPDTVPRSNGVQPVEPAPVSAKEEHPV